MKMNKKSPLVSVIVTTYNRKDLLKKTLESILNQTFRNFELIVVDNYSDYDFTSYMNSFTDSRIGAFQNQNNGIIAVNRNFGIKKTKGNYIAFCDDDDLWHPEKLDLQLKKVENNDCGLCFTNFDYINSEGKKLTKKHKIKRRYRNLTFNKFIFSGGCVCNSTVLIRRELIDTVGLLNEDPLLIAVEDSHYWSRILHKYKACYVDKKLVSYQINSKKSIQPATNTDWYRKELYLLRSINSIVSINKIYYSVKYIKLTVLFLLNLLKSAKTSLFNKNKKD